MPGVPDCSLEEDCMEQTAVEEKLEGDGPWSNNGGPVVSLGRVSSTSIPSRSFWILEANPLGFIVLLSYFIAKEIKAQRSEIPIQKLATSETGICVSILSGTKDSLQFASHNPGWSCGVVNEEDGGIGWHKSRHAEMRSNRVGEGVWLHNGGTSLHASFYHCGVLCAPSVT